jgi:hypothetical protein
VSWRQLAQRSSSRSSQFGVGARALRRIANPDRIGEWQSRDGRIIRDAGRQGAPESRSQRPKAIGSRGAVRKTQRLHCAVEVIDNAGKSLKVCGGRRRVRDRVWHVAETNRLFPRVSTRVPCM